MLNAFRPSLDPLTAQSLRHPARLAPCQWHQQVSSNPLAAAHCTQPVRIKVLIALHNNRCMLLASKRPLKNVCQLNNPRGPTDDSWLQAPMNSIERQLEAECSHL